MGRGGPRGCSAAGYAGCWMLLKAALLLDGTDRPAVHDAALDVGPDGRIVAVGRAADVAGARADVLDLGPACLLPGLIDLHGHLRLSHLEPEPAKQVHDSEPTYVARAIEHLQTNLTSGVTTMRCNGDRDFLDVRLREQVAAGALAGPRLLVATRGIKSPSCTGGMVATVLVDGESAIAAAVADNARQGADHIKIFTSGGLGPPATATQLPWSAAEIRAAVEAAHAAGLPIVAHCHGGPSARALIEAGVDSLEHGSYLSPAELEAMAQRGTVLDMTLGILLDARSVAHQHLQAQLGTAGFARLCDEVLATMRRAVALGVRITLGTDTMHGLLSVEAQALADLGVAPAAVVQTLTGRAAAVLGLADLTGTLRPGLAADVIAVAGDPLADLATLAHPLLVMRGGRIVYTEGDVCGV